MDYFELRGLLEKVVPRKTKLENIEKESGLVKEKGRKSNYQEFSLETGEFVSIQRLLNKEEMNSFLEVSLRAAHCPMPFNADVWDGLRCGFGCKYCFADSFRASLYTSFFDNSKNLGLRHCNPDFFKKELDKLMAFRGKTCTSRATESQKAISLEIPIRLGIRFEDFLPREEKMGISLEFLRYLSEIAYPTMINTKSSLIGRDGYVDALGSNLGGSAVHITMISSNDLILKKLEPGAPAFKERIEAAKNLTSAGIRVVARIEPLMIFINDNKDDVIEWMDAILGAGIKNITFDTYSWSATAPGVKRQMETEGFDFERMFLLMADSQWLGSLILNKFIRYLKEYAWKKNKSYLSCSTFDFGNVPFNDQDICCEVGDVFKGFSYGNTLSAIRFIKKSKEPVTWTEFDKFVEEKGGWLSQAIRRDVFEAWNLVGNPAYFPDWAMGVEPHGYDALGHRVWKYNGYTDFREEMLQGILS